MKRGFTLLELIVVIIIIGILGALGFIQYTKVVEKGRSAEAKDILGQLRKAEEAYRLENGTYTDILSDLMVDAPTACTTTHYFSYGATNVDGPFASVYAQRCTANGKSPNGTIDGYGVMLNIVDGTWYEGTDL